MKYAMAILAVLLPLAAWAETPDMPQARADLKNAEGQGAGTVTLTEGPNGLLADIALNGIAAGWHAVHIHETGDCGADGFTSAGGHASHGEAHGFMVENGMHPGDMPNLWAHADGTVQAQYFLPGLKLAQLLDADGAAVIVHADSDDYRGQPSGNAGERIACGVLK